MAGTRPFPRHRAGDGDSAAPEPGALGLEPDGVLPTDRGTSAPQPAVAFAAAIRSRYFYAVSLAYLFLLGAQVGAIAHFYRLASTRTGVATAALALSVLAGSSTIGRLAGGWIMLKVPALPFALALMLMQAVGLALLAVAEDPAQILIGTVAFGITMGNSLMMHPLLLAERFGSRDYGRIYSTSQLVTVLGVAGCPALIGVLYEAAGGCGVPFLRCHRRHAVGFAFSGLFGKGPPSPRRNRHQVGFLPFVVASCDPPTILDLVEEPLDAVARDGGRDGLPATAFPVHNVGPRSCSLTSAPIQPAS